MSVLCACTGGNCIDNTCPDPDRTTSLPGPCRSVGRFDAVGVADRTCKFAYDLSGHVAVAQCYENVAEPQRDPDSLSGHEANYFYDTNHQVNGINMSRFVRGKHFTAATWTFADQAVTIDMTAAYDRATFALFPMMGSELALPRAELGIASSAGLTYTWQVHDPIRDRRAIKPDGSVDEIARYTLDGARRLVSVARCFGCDSVDQVQPAETFEYRGDRLVRHTLLATPRQSAQDVTYEYDRGGNLIALDVTSPDGSGREVYTYECW